MDKEKVKLVILSVILGLIIGALQILIWELSEN